MVKSYFKLQFPQKLFVFAGLIYFNKCSKKMNIKNQTLYHEIVGSFFPVESSNPKSTIYALSTTKPSAVEQKLADTLANVVLMFFSTMPGP